MRPLGPLSAAALVASATLAWPAATALHAQDSGAVQEALSTLEWRPVGPANMGGRVTAIAGVPGDRDVWYFGGADGGVFRTTDGGTTWDELFTDQPVYSVGALAVADSDPQVIWVGTGEGDPRNSVSYGNGVYRSTDGGDTWTHLGLDGTERIHQLRVHPWDADVAWVCAMGREWGPNPERGVFKTTDGGETWDHVLYVDEDTGCSDLDLSWENPRELYAGMWTFRRRPWRFDDGGRETALYRSTDGGETWESLRGRPGMPTEPLARIGVAVAQSEPSTVFMITETPTQGTLFRSDDKGRSWTMVNENRDINFRPFYYSDVLVDPSDAKTLITLSGGLYRSRDGGKTFERIARDVHGDHQSFWIDPTDGDRMLSGSDGGYQVSNDGGDDFDIINTVALSQFYQIDVDDRDPYMICGGLQDNGNWCGPSHSLHSEGILKDDWFSLSGGDGFYSQSVPGMPWLVYTNSQGGSINLVDTRTGASRHVHPYPKIVGSAGDAIADHRYRFNWDAPIHISPHDPATVYFGGNVVFRSTDFGQSWDVISPDLTTDDPEKQRTSGGEIYQDNTAAEFHTTILTIEESPVERGVIWVGSDDGLVHLTRDGGGTWTEVTGAVRRAGLPEEAWIAKFEASNHVAGRAYLAVDNHRMDDFAPYAFVTDDYGETWRNLAPNGLPQDDYVKVIREDERNPDVLYVGMERGLQVSLDRGRSWYDVRGENLPPVSVRDVQQQAAYNDVVIGTHGRGAWVLDDVTRIQRLSEAIAGPPYLFPVRTATRWEIPGTDANLGQRVFAAPNPPFGALVDFYLADEPDEALEATVADAGGSVIRTFEIDDAEAGLNRAVWDLRHDGPEEVRGEEEDEEGGWWGRPRGPLAVPGTYTLTLRGDGWERSRPVEVRGDPRIEMTAPEYRAQLEALVALREMTSEVNRAITVAGSLKRQLDGLATELRVLSDDGEAAQLIRRVEAARAAVDSVEAEYLQRPPPDMGYRQRPRVSEELQRLSRYIGGAEAPPTEPQKLRVREIGDESREAVDALQAVIDTVIRDLNEELQGRPHLMIQSGRLVS